MAGITCSQTFQLFSRAPAEMCGSNQTNLEVVACVREGLRNTPGGWDDPRWSYSACPCPGIHRQCLRKGLAGLEWALRGKPPSRQGLKRQVFCASAPPRPVLNGDRVCIKLLQSCLTLWDLMGPQPTRVLCPWDSLGKNTRVGCHALLQGIFPTQVLNPCLLCLLLWQAGSLPLALSGLKEAWLGYEKETHSTS